MSDELVREFLRQHGASDIVVAAGVDGLIEAWSRTVQHVERGYPFSLDDYLNDLDARQLLHEVLGAVPGAGTRTRAHRLGELDARLRNVTRKREDCLWGDAIADREAWSPDVEWWYWAVPKEPGEDLAADLEG